MKILTKTNPNSFFEIFHHSSNYAEKIFCDKPKHKASNVIILQVMQIEGGNLIVELLKE